MRFPKRVDSNQSEIVQTFRDLGCTVFITSSVGGGYPDLSLSYRGNNYLVEIKDGKKPLSQQKLTPSEQLFFKTWKGQVCIINSVNAAINFIETINVRMDG